MSTNGQDIGFAPDVSEFSFNDANLEEAKSVIARYPEGKQASAVIPLLMMAQKQHGGWLPKAVMDYVAAFLEMPKIRVYEVATFYDMFYTEPVGKTKVRVCTTTPCWLCGSDDIVKACQDALGVDIGQSTADGRFFLREFECLGACANAPVLWVDDDFFEDLDYDKAKAIVEALKRGERPQAGPQSGRKGSIPAAGRTSLFKQDGDHAA